MHVVNDHMPGVMPKEFVYITTSLHVSSKADLTTLLKNPQICGVCRQCQEDCLGHLCPCALDMGGIYQYTKKGLLNEAWSGKHKKGSIGFITECNEGCGCSEGCSNRVVQRGMTRRMQVIHPALEVFLHFRSDLLLSLDVAFHVSDGLVYFDSF
jgi:Na+-translocating ferredoxin:NAD+ oxidoreductase RnfC subunit